VPTATLKAQDTRFGVSSGQELEMHKTTRALLTFGGCVAVAAVSHEIVVRRGANLGLGPAQIAALLGAAQFVLPKVLKEAGRARLATM
jgi:hypothetical protein